MGFEACHPAVNLLYFAAVLFGMISFKHPIFLGISYLCAFAYSVKRNKWKAVVFNCVLIPLAAVYALCYEGAIRLLTEPLARLPAWGSNLVISLVSSGVGAALSCAPHRFMRDKRLVFGGHLWLCGYAAAILGIMLVMMGFSEAFGAFLIFFGWAVALPVSLGTGVSAVRFRRDRQPAKPAEPEPEWKKYVNRRTE